MQAFHKGAGFFDFPIHGRIHAGHDPHVGDHIGAVGNLDAVLRDGRAHRAHAEGDDIHRAAPHAARVERPQARLHLFRRLPVVRRSGVFFRARADEGALLHAGHIPLVAADEQGVWTPFRVQPHAGARGHYGAPHGEVLGFRAIAPMDGVGLGEGGNFLHPPGHCGGCWLRVAGRYCRIHNKLKYGWMRWVGQDNHPPMKSSAALRFRCRRRRRGIGKPAGSGRGKPPSSSAGRASTSSQTPLRSVGGIPRASA